MTALPGHGDSSAPEPVLTSGTRDRRDETAAPTFETGEGPGVPEEKYDRGRARRFRHAVRRWVKRPLLWLALTVVPRLYLAYLRLVWATSRIEDGIQRIHDVGHEHDGVVCLLWHEEVFSVVWSYRDFRPHTLASVGDAGEVIARTLERTGYVVFRGGSAKNKTARSSRRREVLPDMIEHMKETHEVFYGLTVDGSMGPRYRMKKGGIVIARDCGKPVCLARCWAKRNIRVPTWDRMAIPLPFNRIHRRMRGPFFVPADANDPERLEVFRRELERELAKLAEESYLAFGQKVPEGLYAAY